MVTVWLKPPVELTLIVESPAVPALTVRDVGLAVKLNPATLKTVIARLVEFVMSLLVPPVPVIVTV
jgi:hypothetical protein